MDKDIREIRRLVENREISFIIGAGFSRNIYKNFPLWRDLLYPMIGEMYPKVNGKKAKDELISNMGYLDIASEYVRRAGYHESIDVYIKKHTPYLEKNNDDTFRLMLKGKCIDQKPNMRCHQKLRSLKIANIYTFNYDNALDIIAETDKADIYQKVITNANHDISLLKKIKKEYEDFYEKLKKSEGIDRITEINDKTEIKDITGKTLDKKLETFKKNIYSLNDQLNSSLNIFKENTAKYTTDDLPIIDKRINECIYERDKAEHGLNSVYQLIKNGYQISLTEKRNNIYKLHGSLRLGSLKEDFGFDGDKHKQFIITKEDYEEYPSKHEAFVNLMKVSLLKGSFCLVGFSCDDPNFLMWMKWVKDVLDKNPENTKKIYFINLEKNHLNEDKLLFLNNNYLNSSE